MAVAGDVVATVLSTTEDKYDVLDKIGECSAYPSSRRWARLTTSRPWIVWDHP
jgi:hypothetical protein